MHANAEPLDGIMYLTLQESHSLPILTYAVADVKYSTEQEDALNTYWNSVYRKLFGFNKWESVKCFISGLGHLDLHHITKIQFYLHVYVVVMYCYTICFGFTCLCIIQNCLISTPLF